MTRTRVWALGRACPRAGAIPIDSTRVKNAPAYGEPAVRARNRPQSICSRSARAIATSLE